MNYICAILTNSYASIMERTNRSVTIPQTFPVVLSLLLVSCFQIGTVKSMGFYLEDITWSLGTTSADIGVALGLFAAFSYFPAPLVVALYRLKWIRRVLLISGSCLVSLGVIFTALAPSNVMIAVYLAMAGMGHCLLGISLTVALDQLASKQNFDVLYGVGMSGFGLGMVLLPFLSDVLGQVYGWRGGLLILGGLMANLVPCAIAIQVEPSLIQGRITDNLGITDNIQEDGPYEEKFSNDCPTSGRAPLCHGSSSGTRSNSPPQHKLLDDDPSRNSSVVDQIRNHNGEPDLSLSLLLDRFRDCIRRSDFYKDPLINIMFLVAMLDGVVYCGWHAFLVPHAFQRGYSIRATILMTFFASVGNFFGRLLSGALSDRLVNPIILFFGATLLNAFAILCDVFINQYYLMFVTACLSAITIASMSVLGPLAVRRRISPDNFDVAYAVYEQTFGFGTFLGGYLSGVVGGRFSSYNATFTLLAGVELLVCLLLLPILRTSKHFNHSS